MPANDLSVGARIWIAFGCALCVLFATRAVRAQECVGDCDDSGAVTVNEMILGVNINLGADPVTVCPAFDCDDTGTVPVNCLIQGVNNLLGGCGEPCPFAAGAYTLTQLAGGTLRVGSLSPIDFPAGGTIVLDVGNASAPECVHDVVVPFPGGLTVAPFCIPAFGFSVSLTQTGCGIGRIASDGGADYNVSEIGDTSSQPECNNQQECVAGIDSKVRVDVTVGDGASDPCASGSANAIFNVPVEITVWLEVSTPPMCPGTEFNPGTDTLILRVQQVLDFTTDTNAASWMDLSGDGCAIAGTGPAAGLSNTGACWDIAGQSIGIAASGTVASASSPLFDFTFSTTLPNSVSAEPPRGATCDSPPAIDFDGTVIRCLE